MLLVKKLRSKAWVVPSFSFAAELLPVVSQFREFALNAYPKTAIRIVVS